MNRAPPIPQTRVQQTTRYQSHEHGLATDSGNISGYSPAHNVTDSSMGGEHTFYREIQPLTVIFLTVILLNPPALMDLHVCSLCVMMSLQMKTILNHIKKCVRCQLFPSANLSVDFVELGDQVSVAAAILDIIWNKASQLLHTSNSIAVTPGLDPKSHIVIRASGNRPHLVWANDRAVCMWQSLWELELSMCSHTVAVAEVNGELSKFVAWFVKAKKKASVSKFILTGITEGRGRKGGKHPQSKDLQCRPGPL